MNNDVNVEPVFRIRISTGMLLGLPDPHPDPFVRGTDPRIRIRIRIRTKMSRIPSTRNHFDAEPGPTFHFDAKVPSTRNHFDAEPGPTFQFDANLNSYPTSSYTQVEKTFFFTFIHSNVLHCYIFLVNVISVISVITLIYDLYPDPGRNTTEHLVVPVTVLHSFKVFLVELYENLREMSEGVANVSNIARQIGEAVSVSVRPQFCNPNSDSQRKTILYLILLS
jgi:hypothetical protein